MELRTLRYFVAVAEELHFGRAAQRLNIAQPPLSQQIQKLERELNTQLLVRTKRMVALTPAGEFLLQSARAILQQARAAAAGVRAVGDGVFGTLNIAAINAFAAQGRIYEILGEFRRLHPGVATNLTLMTSVEALAALHTGTIDVAFVRAPIRDRTLASDTVMFEQLLAALPVSHPLAAGEGALSLVELRDEKFVMLPRSAGFGLSEQIMQLCKAAGFAPHVEHDARELPSLVGLVAAGFGVSLVPSSGLIAPPEGVVFRAISPSETVKTICVRRSDDTSRPLVEFVATVRRFPAIQSTQAAPKGTTRSPAPHGV